jgi:predicted transcriptional regulator
MSGVGFVSLSELEVLCLQAFGSDGYLSLPYKAMESVCDRSQTAQLLKQLISKGLIAKSKSSYKLTYRGKAILSN